MQHQSDNVCQLPANGTESMWARMSLSEGLATVILDRAYPGHVPHFGMYDACKALLDENRYGFDDISVTHQDDRSWLNADAK